MSDVTKLDGCHYEVGPAPKYPVKQEKDCKGESELVGEFPAKHFASEVAASNYDSASNFAILPTQEQDKGHEETFYFSIKGTELFDAALKHFFKFLLKQEYGPRKNEVLASSASAERKDALQKQYQGYENTAPSKYRIFVMSASDFEHVAKANSSNPAVKALAQVVRESTLGKQADKLVFRYVESKDADQAKLKGRSRYGLMKELLRSSFIGSGQSPSSDVQKLLDTHPKGAQALGHMSYFSYNYCKSQVGLQDGLVTCAHEKESSLRIMIASHIAKGKSGVPSFSEDAIEKADKKCKADKTPNTSFDCDGIKALYTDPDTKALLSASFDFALKQLQASLTSKYQK